jgi:hypothetical protein
VEGGESSPSRPATKVLPTRTEELRRVRSTGLSTAVSQDLRVQHSARRHPVAEVTVFSKQRQASPSHEVPVVALGALAK